MVEISDLESQLQVAGEELIHAVLDNKPVNLERMLAKWSNPARVSLSV